MQSLNQLDNHILELWTRYDAALEHELNLFVPTPDALGRLQAQAAGGLRDLGQIVATIQPGTIPAVHGSQLRDAMEEIGRASCRERV